MKKLFYTFCSCIFVTLVVDVVLLIMTKAANFDHATLGRPLAVAAHVHLMVLGALFFLILISLEKLFSITTHKRFSLFYIIYIIGLSLSVVLILYKGIAQIYNFNTVRAITEGGAAIGHSLLVAGFVIFMVILYNRIFCNKEKLPPSVEPTDQK